ncbi:heavy-metal-associated domain-containing protein [Vulcanisaeta thermophila]|uniref:heavy-metal-associated domain-containing protein n=1 Tax=Vulcanisaeta thermophila TaxID=867917 RepID=UPI0008539C84|nr:heavy-metal-associated domain-containing protein [Vulcanisaeta thermophila]
MEVTRAVRFEDMGCEGCVNLVLDSLRSMDGVLMVARSGNELIITYDSDKVTFSDLMNMVMMHGLALYLRRIVLRLGNARELGLDEVQRLYREFNDLVSLVQDVTTHRLFLLMHPDSNPSPLINELRRLGLQVSDPVIDELG